MKSVDAKNIYIEIQNFLPDSSFKQSSYKIQVIKLPIRVTIFVLFKVLFHSVSLYLMY